MWSSHLPIYDLVSPFTTFWQIICNSPLAVSVKRCRAITIHNLIYMILYRIFAICVTNVSANFGETQYNKCLYNDSSYSWFVATAEDYKAYFA